MGSEHRIKEDSNKQGSDKQGSTVLLSHLYLANAQWYRIYAMYVYYKPVKRFQMKSNGCRDVQHTGLQSTQTRSTQTRGTRSAHLPKHPYISGCTACQAICCDLELISVSYNYHAATDVGMLGKMCRASAPCLCAPCLCAL